MKNVDIASAKRIITMARKRARESKNASAKLALEDAKHCLKSNWPGCAAQRALFSLVYSVGVFHADYIQAKKLAGE